ncbi:MAG: hypothetical protein WC454_09215 [Phycisphaerae bacterium]|jgi:hypothetical protein
MSQKTNWEKIKEWYVEGAKDKQGNVTYPTLEDVAEKTGAKPATVRQRAARQKWNKLRKGFVAKVTTLRQEKKSEAMAVESVEFDQQCMSAAEKGVTLINKELDTLSKELPELHGEDLVKAIFGRMDAITKYGKALNDYQKAGRVALGEKTGESEPPTLNINVVSDKSKKLTEAIIDGKGSE